MFAENGYDGTSVRGVARLAGVDPALIHHFFRDKAELFMESVRAAFDEEQFVERLTTTDFENLGVHVARRYLEQWEDPQRREPLMATIRAAVTSRDAALLLSTFVTRQLRESLERNTELTDAPTRAALIGAHLVGVALSRYILRSPTIVDLALDELVERVGATAQAYLSD